MQLRPDEAEEDSEDDEDTVEAPEAPPPPLEAPPEGAEYEEPLDDEVPPPPMGEPPSLERPGLPEGPAHEKLIGDIDVGSLSPGRLTIKLIQGHNIRKAGQAAGRTKVDACVSVRLGKHKKAPRLKSRVIKKANEQPNFNGEILAFDVLDVAEFVQGGDITLTLELLDENTFANATLGTMTLSIIQFMQASNAAQLEKFPLAPPDAQRDIFKMDLEMEVCYKASKVGMLLMTLYEGRRLKNPDLLGKQDPYLQFQIGEKYKKTSKTIVDGGETPYFKEEQIAMWVDQKNWVHDLVMEAWDKDVGTDDLIGQTKLSLIDLMNEVDHPDLQQERLVELFSRDGGRSHGHVLMKPQFLPAGSLNIHVHEAKHLREISTGGRQDPYIAFTVDGSAVQIHKKTKVDTDGGLSPVWDEVVTLHVVDHYQLEVACWDHDLLAEDKMIGKCTVSLLPIFKTGLVDTWVTLMSPNSAGIQQPAGDLHLSFDFDGPRGVGYPQHVEGIDAFDETHRVQEARRKEAEAEQKRLEAAKRGIKLDEKDLPSRLATDILATAEAPAQPRDTTFTDAEIEAAFHFLDLDKNGYVGAAEIRHVLICMGELITDEEVDMMINMVDLDGDGQVSYQEFYELVTDPDPSRPDFGKKAVTDEKVEAKINPAAQMQRQREAAAREEKRSMLGTFVKDNNIGMAEVKYAFDTFMARPAEKRKQGIDFKLFCKLMRVESTGEYHKLFALFDADNSGDVDIKELILGLLNFVESGNKSERCDYIFRVYDEDNSGFIDIEELISILSANHMQSRDAVKKKAETIMRTADADGSGELSMDEFRIVAEKFPNILFPASAV